jgi:hypothetical protein
VQPDVADTSKPYILNFDSMLPMMPDRMSALREYFMLEAFDKIIP